jgi:hypothetical protein
LPDGGSEGALGTVRGYAVGVLGEPPSRSTQRGAFILSVAIIALGIAFVVRDLGFGGDHPALLYVVMGAVCVQSAIQAWRYRCAFRT